MRPVTILHLNWDGYALQGMQPEMSHANFPIALTNRRSSFVEVKASDLIMLPDAVDLLSARRERRDARYAGWK
jgi:hypothetical protein